MSYRQFVVSDTNPNDTHGGGGCICDARQQVDCKPPYAIFHGNSMEDPRSPHAVLCKDCVLAAAAALGGELLVIGEKNVVPGTAAAQPTPESQARRSPVVESPDPKHDFDDDTPDI